MNEWELTEREQYDIANTVFGQYDLICKVQKAAQRKLMEWGDKVCYEHKRPMVKRRRCDQCWKELEVKHD